MAMEVRLKNISPENAKKIIELVDENNISLEEIKEFIKLRKEANNKMTNEKMTEEEFIQKQEEDIEKVEKYINTHPGVEYREAVLTVLEKDELNESEKKVDEYMELHKNVTYRQAVLTVLDKSE